MRRDTLRQLSGELEQTLYNVIMGEKRADEAHGKLLHIHSLSQVRVRTWRHGEMRRGGDGDGGWKDD